MIYAQSERQANKWKSDLDWVSGWENTPARVCFFLCTFGWANELSHSQHRRAKLSRTETSHDNRREKLPSGILQIQVIKMSLVLRHVTSIGPEPILLMFVIRTAATDVRQDGAASSILWLYFFFFFKKNLWFFLNTFSMLGLHFLDSKVWINNWFFFYFQKY